MVTWVGGGWGGRGDKRKQTGARRVLLQAHLRATGRSKQGGPDLGGVWRESTYGPHQGNYPPPHLQRTLRLVTPLKTCTSQHGLPDTAQGPGIPGQPWGQVFCVGTGWGAPSCPYCAATASALNPPPSEPPRLTGQAGLSRVDDS